MESPVWLEEERSRQLLLIDVGEKKQKKQVHPCCLKAFYV